MKRHIWKLISCVTALALMVVVICAYAYPEWAQSSSMWFVVIPLTVFLCVTGVIDAAIHRNTDTLKTPAGKGANIAYAVVAIAMAVVAIINYAEVETTPKRRLIFVSLGLVLFIICEIRLYLMQRRAENERDK